MSERRPVHTLVFDLDDTLYPEREFVLGGFRAVDRWLEEKRSARGFFETAVRLFSGGHRGKIFDEALVALGVPAESKLISDLVEVYRAHEPQISLFPDAREILAWAVSRVELALITDGYGEVQINKIRALGLDKIISCRVVTDLLGRAFWKPSPEPYRNVMSHFPGPADGFLYVGDNARKDFIAARVLGWRTVRIIRPAGEHAGYRGGPGEAAAHEIESLLELKDLVATAVADISRRDTP